MRSANHLSPQRGAAYIERVALGGKMIIWGWRGITSSKDSGNFHCPQCETERPYTQKRVRRFFTLYFIPLIPLEHLGEYVECRQCRGQFKPKVLEYNPQAAQATMAADLHGALKNVIVAMTVAGGAPNEKRIEAARVLSSRFSDQEVSPDEIRKAVDAAGRDGQAVLGQLQRLAPRLNDNGKHLIIKAAVMAAAGGADGDQNRRIQGEANSTYSEEQRALLARIAQSLGMSPAHFQGVLTALESEAT
jgi:zinc-ribbon family